MRTTQSHPGDPRCADHCTRAWDSVTHPNRWWVADFTYAYTHQGLCYVAFITDIYSRRFLGCTVSQTTQSDVVRDALRQAMSVQNRYDAKFRAVGIIHHSDAGFQYTSFQLRTLIEREGTTGSLLALSVMPTITGSWSPLSGCLQARRSDPPRMRTFGTWKEVERATDKWVNWYNTQTPLRLHRLRPAARIRGLLLSQSSGSGYDRSPSGLNTAPHKPRPIHPD
ncbi:transposase [Corynebacterium tuberculostearicum]|uniref:transposase n=1 Tax=Corynebacterium tuberculostearicum TaxID=38304 RepID=UPI00397779B6